MTFPNVGDRAPEVIFQSLDGREVQIDEFQRSSKSLVLVFLRHLG